MWSIDSLPDEDEEMNTEFRTNGVNGKPDIIRELIARCMSAGILFPEEIRQAEQMLRHLNKLTNSTESLEPTTETSPA